MSSKLILSHFCWHHEATFVSSKPADMCTCGSSNTFYVTKRMRTQFNKLYAERERKKLPSKENAGLYFCDTCDGHGSYYYFTTSYDDNTDHSVVNNIRSRGCENCDMTGYVDWITHVKNKDRYNRTQDTDRNNPNKTGKVWAEF